MVDMKRDFTAAEKAWEEGLLKLEKERLLQEAEHQGKIPENVLKRQRERQRLLLLLTQFRFLKGDSAFLQTLPLTREEVESHLKDNDVLPLDFSKKLEQTLSYVTDYYRRKSDPHKDLEERIKKSIYSRFNIKKTWLPL